MIKQAKRTTKTKAQMSRSAQQKAVVVMYCASHQWLLAMPFLAWQRRNPTYYTLPCFCSGCVFRVYREWPTKFPGRERRPRSGKAPAEHRR